MTLDNKKLRLLMCEKGFCVASLARAAGIAESSINLYVNHGTRPRLDNLGKLAKALGVSVLELVKEV